jgi:hypothetical protein
MKVLSGVRNVTTWRHETTFSTDNTENRRDERNTSDGLSRQPSGWQSRLARRFILAEPVRPPSDEACLSGKIYPGDAPQHDPIRRFIPTVADVARRVATGYGYPGQVTGAQRSASAALASLTNVSFHSSFPKQLCVWVRTLTEMGNVDQRCHWFDSVPSIFGPARNGRLARGVIHAWH